MVARLELPVVLAMAPALLFPSYGRLLVLGLVPVIWLSARAAGGRLIPRTPFNAAVGLLLVMVGVSLVVTFDVSQSLGKVSGVLLGVLVFWAVSRWVTTPDRLSLALLAFVLAGGGLALAGLLGADYSRFAERFPGDPGKMPLFAQIGRLMPQVIRGLPGAETGFNPNAVAGSLVLFIPLQVALLAGGAHRWRLPAWAPRWSRAAAVTVQAVLLALTLGAFAAMQSRGAFLGLIAAAGLFLFTHSRRTRVLLSAAALAVVVLGLLSGPDGRVGRVIRPIGTGMAHTVEARLDLWASGLAGIRDYPLTGMGMNTFRVHLPTRYPTATPPYGEVPHAHNHLMQAALDLGLPGLLAYLLLWVIAASQLRAVSREAVHGADRLLARGLGAGLVASFVFGMADAIPLGAKVGVFFWLALALVVGLRQVVRPVVR